MKVLLLISALISLAIKHCQATEVATTSLPETSDSADTSTDTYSTSMANDTEAILDGDFSSY